MIEPLVILFMSLAFWLACARGNYRVMVRHDWLRQIRLGEKTVNYSSDCPNYCQTWHHTGTGCTRCRKSWSDWDATRMKRALWAGAAGPFLAVVLFAGALVAGKQPVQKEELAEQLAKAEKELEAANKKVRELSHE